MFMKTGYLFLLVVLFVFAAPQVRAVDDGGSNTEIREWTSIDGRKLVASYLGLAGDSVYLNLAAGKTVPVPLGKLSKSDQDFIASHPLEYLQPWPGWEESVSASPASFSIQEKQVGNGVFHYTTKRFQIETDVNLGSALTTELGRLFELAYMLNSKAPLGIRSRPDGDFYQVELCSTVDRYIKLGGPAGSAGYYDIPKRRFYAPLELMGIVKGAAGWRMISRKQSDQTTIIHELTHMLCHDTLQLAPLWFSEGYAEYISSIPLEGNSFKTTEKKIAGQILNLMTREHVARASSIPRTTADIGYAGSGTRSSIETDPRKITYHLIPIARMLEMQDSDWAKSRTGYGIVGNRTEFYYRTAHLLVYYFIQIEGESGVRKVMSMLDSNKADSDKLNGYLEAVRRYNTEISEFKQRPGVVELPDGRIQFPASLTPPVQPPDSPPIDPKQIKQGGISILLGGESPASLGAKIENALQENLKVTIKFDLK